MGNPVKYYDLKGEGVIGLGICIVLEAANAVSTAEELAKLDNELALLNNAIQAESAALSCPGVDPRHDRIRELQRRAIEVARLKDAITGSSAATAAYIAVICPALILSPL